MGASVTGTDPTRTIRLSDEFMAGIDKWVVRQGEPMTRSEAIRRLVELGLKAGKK